MLDACSFRASRCLLSSFFVFFLSCGYVVLGTSYALASASIEFGGTYSYCGENDFTPNDGRPARKYAETANPAEGIEALTYVPARSPRRTNPSYHSFTPAHSLCIGAGPSEPGKLEVSGVVRILLASDKPLKVLGKRSDRQAISDSEVVDAVLGIVGADDPAYGLYVKNNARIETPGGG